MTDLKNKTQDLSDRTLSLIIIAVAAVLLIALVAIASAIFNSFLVGVTVLGVVIAAIAFFVTRA